MKTYSERTQSILAKQKKLKNKRNIATASIGGLALVFFLTLFIPYDKSLPSVDKYANSPYYAVIEKLNTLTHVPKEYDSPFEEYIAAPLKSFFDFEFIMMGGAVGSAPQSDMMMNGSSDGNAKYEEVTDNQVAGVIEGDIFKRSDKYIYYLSSGNLSVYSIEGKDSKKVGEYSIKSKDGYNVAYYYGEDSEMFLSNDCNTIYILTSAYKKDKEEKYVTLLTLDVSDPTKIAEKKRLYFSGNYETSRLCDNTLLLVANYRVNGGVQYNKPKEYIPQYGTSKNMTCIPAEDIIVPEDANNTRFTTLYMIDTTTLELQSSKALLSYAEEVYVSEDTIYTTHQKQVKTIKYCITRIEQMTDITAISYADNKLTQTGTVTVAGYVENQYSLDEYEGILRVVTTTDINKYREQEEAINHDNGPTYTSMSPIADREVGTNASLYCIDLDTWKVVSSVEGFAPPNEIVRSVRFDKDKAYVCTSIELQDPVFAFDLSDLSNITYKDTGTISGYSLSLVDFGDYLLGIGYGDSMDNLKLEVYEETSDGVVSVASYEVAYCRFSTEYKSYFIDRENMRIGIAIENYDYEDESPCRYRLIQFDGYSLIRLLNTPYAGDLDEARAVYIDGYLYILGEELIVKEI